MSSGVLADLDALGLPEHRHGPPVTTADQPSSWQGLHFGCLHLGGLPRP